MQGLQRAVGFKRVVLTTSLILLLPSTGRASGFYLQDQSARGTGRAYSGEAADQGPSSMWWNPASIAGIQQSEIDANLAGILLWSKARNEGSTIDRFGQTAPVGGGNSSGVINNGLVPSTAFALRLDRQWAIGLSVTSPFSFITQYDTASWARFAALTSKLNTNDLQPTLAWRPTSWLGIGGGPNIERTLTALSSALPNLSPLQPDGNQTYHGVGWNVGYNVGFQLHLLDDRLTFGAAYRSRIEHGLNGHVAVTGLTGFLGGQDFAAGDAKASFTTPWAATFGVRYRVTARLTLDAQLVRTGWSEFNDVRITYPIRSTTPEGYRDVTSGAIGLDYAMTPHWMVRAGVQYDPTPTPDGTRDPRIPDANRVLLALGTSLDVTRNLSIDASALYLDAGPSNINRDASAYAGTPVSTPVQLLGQVDISGVVLALGTRLRF